MSLDLKTLRALHEKAKVAPRSPAVWQEIAHDYALIAYLRGHLPEILSLLEEKTEAVSGNDVQDKNTALRQQLQQAESELAEAISIRNEAQEERDCAVSGHNQHMREIQAAESALTLEREKVAELRKIIGHNHAILCGADVVLTMNRDHFAEGDMTMWAKDCVTTMVKIAHQQKENEAALSAAKGEVQ